MNKQFNENWIKMVLFFGEEKENFMGGIFNEQKGEAYLKQIISTSLTVYPWIVFRCFLYIPVGGVLGLLTFMDEKKKIGRWKFNYLKFIFIGIPAIYLTFYFVIHFYVRFLSFPYPLTEIATNVIGGIILGFVTITSFYKVENNPF